MRQKACDDFLPRWPTLHLTWVHPRLLAWLLARLEMCVVTPVTHARTPLSRHVTPLSPGPGHRLMPLTTTRVYVGAWVTIVTIPEKRKYSDKCACYIVFSSPSPLYTMIYSDEVSQFCWTKNKIHL